MSPDPAPGWPALRSARFVVVASQHSLQKVPEWRADLWQACRKRSDFDLEATPAGWRMAGVIRERQILRGDVLLVLGGGAGAEHLAELYLDAGKPVLPIHAEIGSSKKDGKGGSRYLHERAQSSVDTFFKLRSSSGSAAGHLSGLRLTLESDIEALAKDVADLIGNFRPPNAFYVRLLATDQPEFSEVEHFFRNVVDIVVGEQGFTRYEMGLDRPEAAFMNVEIFRTLHRAGVVVVDLTGVRPNCMMELGYALARRRRVIISANKSTRLPFDGDKLPTHMWDNVGPLDERLKAYRDWFGRYIDLPPIVE